LIEPIFDARFIPDSYANRVGKGTHAAVDRLQMCARRYRYVLRMDIVKHFPSLDHAVLMAEITRVVTNPDLRWLIEQILASGIGVLADEYAMHYFDGDDASPEARTLAANRPRGLPIGNLTSQFWSNVMMNSFDWFVRRELRCPAYLRYVDDFALFSDDKALLSAWKHAIITRLAQMRLTVHEREAQVIPCEQGIPWLGFVVYPTHRRLKRRNVVNFTRKLEHNIDLYETGAIPFAELDASVQGWINHVRYADSWGLRGHIFANHPIKSHPDPQPAPLPRRVQVRQRKQRR